MCGLRLLKGYTRSPLCQSCASTRHVPEFLEYSTVGAHGQSGRWCRPVSALSFSNIPIAPNLTYHILLLSWTPPLLPLPCCSVATIALLSRPTGQHQQFHTRGRSSQPLDPHVAPDFKFRIMRGRFFSFPGGTPWIPEKSMTSLQAARALMPEHFAHAATAEEAQQEVYDTMFANRYNGVYLSLIHI